jgi:hypothetical protein
MTDDKSSTTFNPAVEDCVFSIEGLNALATRLHDRADTFFAEGEALASVSEAKRSIAAEIELAASVCDRLASLRFDVAEIANETADTDCARKLREALKTAEG